jgi:hypothetical protein
VVVLPIKKIQWWFYQKKTMVVLPKENPPKTNDFAI